MDYQQFLQNFEQGLKNTDDSPGPVETPDGIVDPEVYIVSFPKSGRTWLRVLLGKALIERFHLNPEDILETLKITVAAKAKVSPTKFIHDGSNVLLGKSWTELGTDKSAYTDKKVILLVREPKDLLVSNYFHATKRVQKFDKSISEFIRSDQYGIKKIVTFYQLWDDKQRVPKDFLLLRYEDMHDRPETCLDSVLKFMGVEDIPKQIVVDAVKFASFENMKQLERSEIYNRTNSLRPANAADKDAYKVRRGKIGGYVDYLSEEDIEYIDRVVREADCSFFAQ